jgi:S-methylmethionine-dependent homocysteine/selenocysteine methylase
MPDFLYAGIMPALPEAVGMAQAMADSGLPYIISFMIRQDGRLLDGSTSNKAFERPRRNSIQDQGVSARDSTPG